MQLRHEVKVRSRIRSAARVKLVTAALCCALLPVASTNNVIGYSALLLTRY